MADLSRELKLIRESMAGGGDVPPPVAAAIVAVVEEVVSCVGRLTAALEAIAMNTAPK